MEKISNCHTCKYKNDGCFCPVDKKCSAYVYEPYYVKHTYEFMAREDWVPGEGACWGECPFSLNIKLGEMCMYLKEKDCPFTKAW